MNKKALVLAALASLFLAGCPTSNLNPLYVEKDSDTEPALVGTWVEKGDTPDKGSVKIEKASGLGYKMTVTDPVEGATDTYDLRLVKLGGNLFADLKFESREHTDVKNGAKEKNEKEEMPMGMIPLHMVIKMQVSEDDMAWSTMEDDILRKKPATGTPLLAYLDTDGDGVVVTAGTEALRKYVTEHAKDGFSDPVHWRRVH